LSDHSHKSSTKKARAVQAPQRSNGRLRVAAIMEAAEAVIAEKGFEATTMAEIATRSGTKIGSLYRFFPNKESLADTIVVRARNDLDAVFDQFDAKVSALSIRALADDLLSLLLEPVFNRPAVMKLLDSGPNWSAKREEFRGAVLRRMAKTLRIYSPDLRKEAAANIALVILLNIKAASTHQGLSPSALSEFRNMVGLYIENRLQQSISAKKSAAS
jgi:AcrR family transcriptional regulator